MDSILNEWDDYKRYIPLKTLSIPNRLTDSNINACVVPKDKWENMWQFQYRLLNFVYSTNIHPIL